MSVATAPARERDLDASTLPLGLLAEAALTVVAVVSVLSLRRVFLGTEWFATLALQVIGAHAVAALLRRRGTSTTVSVLGTLAAGTLAVSWAYAGGQTTYGIPTPATLHHLGTAMSDAFSAFGDVKAPTDALEGFLVATAIAMWLGSALADWAAFRVDATVEALLPSATLFVLGAVLGADIDRVLLTGLWIAAVFAFVLFRRADRLGRTAAWVGDRRAVGPRTMVVLGAGLALAAVTVAALVGPRLPGAESTAILSLRDIGDNGPGTRVTVSPLVDIRSRLVDQANVEVFSVRSPVRDYWRLTSLDRFDGRIWSSNGSYGKASGALDQGVPVSGERLTFEQSFQISALSQIWLPAAYEPQAIRSPTPVRYDEVSGTLIVDTGVESADDLNYVVTSALPELDAAQLATASEDIPSDIADTYLDLPADFPQSVRALAQQVTQDARSRYEAALLLQNYFRDGFDYDLDVGSGHDDRAMERFLFEVKRGYCEQFAGTYAAMARSLGIPARVAVGFTQGIADPSDPELYRVYGQNAHAWPEVFLGEYGWVKFEPTPGRGAAFSQAYTFVPEQQVAPGGDPTVPTTAATPPSVPSDSPAGTIPQADPRNPDDFLGGSGGGVEAATPNPWPLRLALAALAFVAASLLYVIVVLVVTVLRRRRRRRAAVEVDQQVALAWDDSIRALRAAGIPVRAAETQRETADRVAARLPSLEVPVRTLAGAVQDVTYAPRPAEPEVGVMALELAAEIEGGARTSMTRTERFRSRFHPQRLLDRG